VDGKVGAAMLRRYVVAMQRRTRASL